MLKPIFCEAPVKLYSYKFQVVKSKTFTVKAPSLQQARNWLSALNQVEVKLLTITK